RAPTPTAARGLDNDGRDADASGAAVAVPGLRPDAAAAAAALLDGASPSRVVLRPAATTNPAGSTRVVPAPGVGDEGRSLNHSGDAFATAADKEAFGVAVLRGGSEKR
ncbi:unnamed protein product, partial [Laminaria digitata]